MAALCYTACGSWSSYETSILVLPVAWNANTPYFMLASYLEETTCDGVVPLRGTIILAGHRRLIIGCISRVVSTHQTFVILSIYGAVNEQMREKVEVHLRVPYEVLTKKARWFAHAHRLLFGSLSDNSLHQAPEYHAADFTISTNKCPRGRFNLGYLSPHDLPLEEDDYIRHLYWRMDEHYGSVHDHCQSFTSRNGREIVGPQHITAEALDDGEHETPLDTDSLILYIATVSQ